MRKSKEIQTPDSILITPHVSLFQENKSLTTHATVVFLSYGKE